MAQKQRYMLPPLTMLCHLLVAHTGNYPHEQTSIKAAAAAAAAADILPILHWESCICFKCLKLKYVVLNKTIKIHFFLCRFDLIAGHCLPLRGFAVILIGHTILGRTPLDEWSAGRRDLYVTAHTTYNTQTSMPLVGFGPPIPEASGRIHPRLRPRGR